MECVDTACSWRAARAAQVFWLLLTTASSMPCAAPQQLVQEPCGVWSSRVAQRCRAAALNRMCPLGQLLG